MTASARSEASDSRMDAISSGNALWAAGGPNSTIVRMATWRTLTKFAEKLFRDWRRLYDEVNEEVKKVA